MREKPQQYQVQIRALPFRNVPGSTNKIRNLLSQEQQSRLLTIATAVEYRQGETVFLEGADAKAVYSIATGVVRLGRHSETGKRHILALLFTGDLFGLPECGKYVNFAEVLQPSLLYCIRLDKMIETIRDMPELQVALLARVAFDLRQTQRRAIMLAHQNALQKLASFLLELTEHQEFFDDTKCRVMLPLTMVELADYLGISPETVTRAFAKLESTDLIQRISNRIWSIADWGGLELLIRGRKRTTSQQSLY